MESYFPQFVSQTPWHTAYLYLAVKTFQLEPWISNFSLLPFFYQFLKAGPNGLPNCSQESAKCSCTSSFYAITNNYCVICVHNYFYLPATLRVSCVLSTDYLRHVWRLNAHWMRIGAKGQVYNNNEWSQHHRSFRLSQKSRKTPKHAILKPPPCCN